MRVAVALWYTDIAMQYLFFDMECADGTHICSLGYVLTDAYFSVREKKDILINPDCPFKLSRAGFDPWIRLAYTEKQFYAHPKFPARYDEIRSLLCAPDRVLLGHSITSDLNFLIKACMRYDLPLLLPDVYDTQLMYARYKAEKQARSLEYIVADLGADTTHLTEHKSCDDAEMAMLTAKRLCELSGCTLAELLAQNPQSKVCGRSIVLARAVRENKKAYPKSRHAPVVCLGDTPDYDLDRRIRLINRIFARGYGYTDNPAKCRYFVDFGGNGERKNACAAAEKEGKRIRKITPRELSDMLRAPVDAFGGTD